MSRSPFISSRHAEVDSTSEATHADWIEHRPFEPLRSAVRISEWWTYRELALQLALRDLKVRYKQTAFGVAWAVLRPLLAMGAFSVVFGHFAKLSSDGLPYPVFVLAGLAFAGFMFSAIETASHSLVEHRELVEKVWFPRVLAPLAGVLGTLPDLGVSLVIVGIAMAAWGIAPPFAVLTLPLWVLASSVVAVGVSLWLSALNVLYRDVQYALGFMLQLWFYVSPVVYSSSLTRGFVGLIFALNPMVCVLDGARWGLLGAPAPTTRDLVSAGVGVLITLTGLLYFARVERQFADRI